MGRKPSIRVGDKFGKLTVVGVLPPLGESKHIRYKCLCLCGTQTVQNSTNIKVYKSSCCTSVKKVQDKVCPVCGSSVFGNGKRVYCSDRCYHKQYRSKNKKKYTRTHYKNNREDQIAKQTYRKMVGSTKGVSESELLTFYIASSFVCNRENDKTIMKRIEYAKSRNLFR